jgi:hypothetical protein
MSSKVSSEAAMIAGLNKDLVAVLDFLPRHRDVSSRPLAILQMLIVMEVPPL